MPTLTELQEKRGRLVTQAREALEEIKSNTDESRTKELEDRHDKIMGEFDALDANIAREQKLADIEKREAEARAARRPPQSESQSRGQDDGKAIEYRDVFRKIMSGMEPSELSTEERTILKAGVTEFRAQSTTNSAGGYTVPTTLYNEIIRSMAMWGPMYDENIATVITTAGGEQINIPTIDDTAVTVAKHTESTALTDDGSKDVTVGQKLLNAFVYDTTFVKWSLELMQDSAFNWEALLASLLGERLGRRANTELTTGDGSGDPNGIVTASSLGVTAASATAITADEVMDLQHAVDPAYRMSPKCRYMFNDSTFKAIRKLKDGNGQYLWDQGIAGGPGPSLFSKPYSINQAMASIATGNKALVFGDFGKYFVRRVGSPIIGVMRERFWPDLGIAGLIRLDGELADTAAVKHLILA